MKLTLRNIYSLESKLLNGFVSGTDRAISRKIGSELIDTKLTMTRLETNTYHGEFVVQMKGNEQTYEVAGINAKNVLSNILVQVMRDFDTSITDLIQDSTPGAECDL